MASFKTNRTAGKKARKNAGQMPPDLYSVLAPYRNPALLKAAWQVINTLVPYFLLWYLMFRSIQLGYSYWWTLMLAVPAAGFLVRIFILFHDCVHGSLFKSQKANTYFGYIFGLLVFTCYEDWRFSHLRHHATYSNLDERGFGDIWTMTRSEYEKSSKKDRSIYRLYRNPLVLVGLGSLFLFLVINRFPTRTVTRKVKTSVLLTNLVILAMVLGAGWAIGFGTYFMIQIPVLALAGAAGIWLFYVQHQFSSGYWARGTEWEPYRAAMEGSSFYKLPALLRWFSGSIGYHHIHHLNPVIPNYNLKKCYDSVPAVQVKKPLTIWKSLSCARLKMWDEELRKMVSLQ
jgi:omega-6 fatty acid desaturase (delta-12 desaturase)